MGESCDRCPYLRAVYRVTLPGTLQELFFCLACTSHHWTALTAQAWEIWPADRHGPAPQAKAG